MQSTSTGSSIYTPLPPRAIRLLTLQPCKGNAPFEGTISIFHLPDDPKPGSLPFQAISYTWGAPVYPYSIRCQLEGDDGSGIVSIGITQGLADAIVALTYSDRNRVLWIDGVCINQRDDLEKSKQIPLMRTIFRSAKRVLVWLGALDESAEKALAILDLAAKHSVSWHSVLDEGRKTCTDEQLTVWGFPGRGRTNWADLTNFFQRPWFSRLWTRQEAILAFDLTCYIGHRAFPWNRLDDAVSFLSAWTLIPIRTEIETLCMARNNFQSYQDDLSRIVDLRTALLLSKGFKASDPRDKVYALVATTRDMDLLDIDYTKSAFQVYQDATRYIISSNNDGFPLEVFSVGLWPLSCLPRCSTWLPADREEDYYKISRKEFLAGGQYSYDAESLREQSLPDALVLSGFIVDTIHLKRGYVPREGTAATAFHIITATISLFESFKEVYFTEESPDQVLAEILTLYFGDPYDSVMNIVRIILIATAHQDPSTPDFESLSAPLRRSLVESDIGSTFTLSGGDTGPEEDELCTKITVFGHRRSGFRTHMGFIGIGDGGLAPGDHLAVIYGSRVPLILRSNGDETFRFIGQCYVHGIMYGELLAEGRETSREFIIC